MQKAVMSVYLNVSIKLRNESVKKSFDNRYKGLGGGMIDFSRF